MEEAPKLFETLEEYIEDEDIKQPFFFSTHPGVKARIRNFEELIERNIHAKPTKSDDNKTRFVQMTQQLFLDDVQMCFHKGMFKTAESNINKYLERAPGSAPGYYYLGELYRQRQDHAKKEDQRDKSEDYSKAIEFYDKAVAADSEYALPHAGKGRVFQKQDKDDEAREAFQTYLSLAPRAEDRAYIEYFLSQGDTESNLTESVVGNEE